MSLMHYAAVSLSSTSTLSVAGTLTAFSSTMYVKDSGTWKISTPYVNDGGVWKTPDKIYKKVSGNWVRVY